MKQKSFLIVAGLYLAVCLFGAAVIGWKDWQLMSWPPSSWPAVGYLRTGADTAANKIKCINSSGAACYFDSGSSGAPIHGLGMAFGVTGGSALTAGTTQYITSPFTCTAAKWTETIDAGTVSADIWKIQAGPVDWALASGTVSTVGTAVSWISGTTFPADAVGLKIKINSVLYVVANVTSSTSLVLTTSAGTQTSVAYTGPGDQIPTVANSIVSGSYPSISTGTAASSTNMTIFSTTAIHIGDVLGFDIQAISGGGAAFTIVLEMSGCTQ